MNNMFFRTFVCLVFYICFSSYAKFESSVTAFSPSEINMVELPPLFSDGVVLQQKSDVNIWGRLKEGSGKVILHCSWSDQSLETYADNGGKFSFSVHTPDAGGPYTISINGTIIKDVMIGEVWLASGQSNMVWPLAKSDMEELQEENNSDIHVFTVPAKFSKKPIDSLCGGFWVHGSIEEMKNNTTAVGYYFARKLQTELNVPIGIICSAKGGSGAEEWISGYGFSKLSEDIRQTFPATAKKWGSCCYNAMINPIRDYIFKGVIWYQGENNITRNWAYATVLETLIRDWRQVFSDKSLPFYIVQLPSFARDGWKELRAQQEIAVDRLNNCQFVPTIDQGEENNVHPVKKIHVGERLGEIVLSNEYGRRDFRKRPPRIRSYTKKGNFLTVKFSDVSRLYIGDGNKVKYMEICGDDGVYYTAEVKLTGKTMKVSSPEVPNPIALRYYWIDYGCPNLFDSDGWPIAPFNRSDN